MTTIALLLSGALAASAGGAQETPACEAIGGVASLLAPGKVLLLGEIHGTEECPAFVGALACHAARAGLEVVVGLELDQAAAGDFETFLDSEGLPSDRDSLLARPPWRRDYQDGRTSRAMADLLDGLRMLRRSGKAVRVVPFDMVAPGDGQARERAMANNIAASVTASPEAIHIVLTGDLHSRITRGNGRGADYEPMGYLLRAATGAERLTALDVAYQGGSAWICAPSCGAASLRGHGPEGPWRIEIGGAERPAGHDGRFVVGTIHASPPAASEVEAPAPTPVPVVRAPRVKPPEEFPAQTPELLQPFQGSWVAYQRGNRMWTLDVREERFRGELGVDDWYEGTIRLRRDTDPMQIDFRIEDCRCGYRGMTSRGVFRESGDSILLSAPTPGFDRPESVDVDDGKTVELWRSQGTMPAGAGPR